MLKRLFVIIIIASIGAFGLTACGGTDASQQASNARDKAITKIRKTQPVQTMTFSPTLDTINAWAKTWGQRGKVSYVYMERQDGTFAGYYVLKGLPVSYCASGSPTYDYVDINGDGASKKVKVPAPGLDGAYYGGSGNCNRYYGFDAVTGQYIEYTDGYVLTAVLSDQPLSLQNQPRPFISSITQVKAQK